MAWWFAGAVLHSYYNGVFYFLWFLLRRPLTAVSKLGVLLPVHWREVAFEAPSVSILAARGERGGLRGAVRPPFPFTMTPGSVCMP